MQLSLPQDLHRQLLCRPHTLLVVRPAAAPPRPAPGQPGTASDYAQPTPEIFVAVSAFSADTDRPAGTGTGTGTDTRAADWEAIAFNGHVDLGTGIRTALAQIVAEELEIPLDRLRMVLGHTGAAPNQGPTIASATLQIAAVPLRRAAAQAREHLLGLAARRWSVPVEALAALDGAVVFRNRQDPCRLGYGPLLRGAGDLDGPGGQTGQPTLLPLAGPDDAVPLKPADRYRIVGRSAARVDIPAKAAGALVFVHDLRLPGMRHGRVVRPPHEGRDGGDFIGHCLIDADPRSVAHLPGNVRVVVRGDFVGVVADREEQAIAAMRALAVRWKPVPPGPDLRDIARALRAQPSTDRLLVDRGDTAAAWPRAAHHLQRSYVWPYQMHASIGPSCAVARSVDGRLTVWAGTQNPHMLRSDLDRLLEVGEAQIEIVRMEAAGCYGRNGADDVCADAALLAIADGAPVRVQLTREQEHQWEPKGAAQLVDVQAALDADGRLLAYDFAVRYPSNDAPLLASLLTGRASGQPRTLEMGDRTAAPPYRYPHQRIVCHDMPPLVRASWLRGVSALPNTFAHESMVDELAHAAGADPVEFRIRHLDDPRAVALVQATARRAAWQAGATGSRGRPGPDGLLRGRGIAYARYVHSRFPGFGAAWAAWVVDLCVEPASGRIRIERVVVGQDTGLVVNPAGVRHQIHGNVIQTVSRTLMERVGFDHRGVTSREWGTYPIARFADVPDIEVLLMDRQDCPPMGGGESAAVPGPAALANALFDATGRRFYEAPFTEERVRGALTDV
ncbi:molybdopterin-dependent oxidoreductase [Xylophilus sp. Kf1]|nr:molybdopterin-dependent oxidoreductase [Xylophilus sp. Kf1]